MQGRVPKGPQASDTEMSPATQVKEVKCLNEPKSAEGRMAHYIVAATAGGVRGSETNKTHLKSPLVMSTVPAPTGNKVVHNRQCGRYLGIFS